METFIIRERESKKEIKRFTDGNEAMKELRRMANQKKEENADDWNFYEMITKREKDLEKYFQLTQEERIDKYLAGKAWNDWSEEGGEEK